MTNGTIFVLNPTATEGSSTRKLSPRPKQMRNLVIGLLDNRKPNANIFMARLEELLKQKFDTVTIVKRQKSSLPVETKDTQNPTDRLLDELAGACHAVINGVGDWGGCTSWSIHDSVELEKRGKPVTTIISSAFTQMAKTQAGALGYPGLPIVTVPHPIGGLKPEAVRKKVDDAFEEILRLMTASE